MRLSKRVYQKVPKTLQDMTALLIVQRLYYHSHKHFSIGVTWLPDRHFDVLCIPPILRRRVIVIGLRQFKKMFKSCANCRQSYVITHRGGSRVEVCVKFQNVGQAVEWFVPKESRPKDCERNFQMKIGFYL
jgi:hypothetical protein